MPHLATLRPVPFPAQTQILIRAHGTLTRLLDRMGRIRCHTLHHDEQQLMVTIYMGLERERDTIAAALHLSDTASH